MGGTPTYVIIGFQNKVYYDSSGGPYFDSANFWQAMDDAIDSFPTEGVYVNFPIDDKYYLQGHVENLDISNVFGDVEGDDITVTLENNSNPSAVDVVLNGDLLTITVSDTEVGSSAVILKGSDLLNTEEATYEFTIYIDKDAPIISNLYGNTQGINNDMTIKVSVDDPNSIDYVRCQYTIDGIPTTIDMIPAAKINRSVIADAKATSGISTKSSKLLTQYTCVIPAQADPTMGTIKILTADIGGNSTESIIYDIEWIASLLYEDFEGSNWPPDGWQLKYDTTLDGLNLVDPGGLTWFHCDEASFGDVKYMHSGDFSTAIGYTAPDFNWMITPEITFDGDYDLKFWMWYFNDVGNSWITKFHVLVKTGRNWDVVLSVSSASDPINEYATEMILDLSAYSGITGNIAFVYESNDGFQFAFDDMQLVSKTSIEEGVTPKSTTLYQNYPNPFNPTTEINFSIQDKGVVSLNVYNYKGQLVESLVDGNLNKGLHKVNFDASNYSTGVYYYTLKADNTSMTRKMVLVK
ncbi:MAG: choice-of-anchor J domain-containing protein [Candidatus Delongbacteria bacterium]|nr:choice-of-anchor J domain-containing protein [Candidatus Delongbacteria bacterium]